MRGESYINLKYLVEVSGVVLKQPRAKKLLFIRIDLCRPYAESTIIISNMPRTRS